MLLCASRSKGRRPIGTRHVGAARRTYFGPAQADASATATGSGGVFRGGAAATAPARETRFGPAQGTAAARGVHFRPAQAGATTTATGSEVTLFGPAQAGAAATATARGDTCQARAATRTAHARLRRDAAVETHPVHVVE